jgi:hypothetical protein
MLACKTNVIEVVAAVVICGIDRIGNVLARANAAVVSPNPATVIVKRARQDKRTFANHQGIGGSIDDVGKANESVGADAACSFAIMAQNAVCGPGAINSWIADGVIVSDTVDDTDGWVGQAGGTHYTYIMRWWVTVDAASVGVGVTPWCWSRGTVKSWDDSVADGGVFCGIVGFREVIHLIDRLLLEVGQRVDQPVGANDRRGAWDRPRFQPRPENDCGYRGGCAARD